jgi:hypothetical protein
MSSFLIASTPRASYNAMRYQGILVTDSYAQLRAALEKKLSPEHALLFAEPVHDAAGASTDWYTACEGTPTPLDSLSPEAKTAAVATISRLASDINSMAEDLMRSPEASKIIRGNILSLALRYPDSGHIYMAGGQPVIICWGFEHGTAGAQPEDLMRLGVTPAKTLPPPPPAVAPSAFNWRRAPLFFLLGLLLLAGLIVFAGMLLNSAAPSPAGCAALPRPVGGCAPTPAATAIDSELIASLTAEQEKERSLRRQLDDLRGELQKRAAQCRRVPEKTGPPATREKAALPPAEIPRLPDPPVEERHEPPVDSPPPLLADMMPTTPDETPPENDPPSLADMLPQSPPEPEKTDPPAAPKAGKKAPEKPKAKPQARGEDLRIPDDAKKNKDLSFLEGCWNSETGLRSERTNEPIDVQYCFDAKGRGTRTITTHESRDRCIGSVQAQFDSSGKLIIDADGSPCNKGGGFVPQHVECSSNSGKADCDGRERGRSRLKWKARFRRD